jgi:AcrR family transcriptional regulator
MVNSKPENYAREQRILDATAALIMRQGYDKTTMSDVADEVGISRGIVYLHFDSKEKLFEALFQRELLQYVQAWLEHIEANPRGGTIGGVYRAVRYALSSRPLMAAMLKRDRRVGGSYLRKTDNLFASMQPGSMNVELLQAFQAAGSVRQDIDLKFMAHIIDILSIGLLTVGDFRQPDELPPLDAVMETLAEMLDRLLTPEDGGNSEAGKAVIRQIAGSVRQQFERGKPRSESSDT